MIDGKLIYKGRSYIEVKDKNNENCCDECDFRNMHFCYNALSRKNKKKCYENYSHWELVQGV